MVGSRIFFPFHQGERDLIIHRFREMVSATIYGGILIAIIQGALGASPSGFWGSPLLSSGARSWPFSPLSLSVAQP